MQKIHNKKIYTTTPCPDCGNTAKQVLYHYRVATLVCQKCKRKIITSTTFKRLKKFSIPPFINTKIPNFFLARHKITKIYYIIAWLEYEKQHKKCLKLLTKSTHTTNIIDAIYIRNKILEPTQNGFMISI